MRSEKRTGRIVGILLLLQMACGLTLPFMILRPRLVGFPVFLTAAAASSTQIRLAVFLSFAGAALTVSIAITAWPVFSRYSSTLARWFLAICVISCTLDAVHNATVMSMLSLSERYAEAGVANAELYQALGAGVQSTRYWAHYTQLLGFGAWISLFYISLLRFGLIPRALAALGVIGITLQFIGVTLPAFADFRSVPQLAMPLGLIHLSVAVWLLVRGFTERRLPPRS